MPMLNPNKLSDAVRLLEIAIEEDSDIKQDTEVDLVTGLKKNELKGTVESQADFLAGVFLYVIKCTRNPGKSGVIGPIMERLVKISPAYTFSAGKNQSVHSSEKEDKPDKFRSPDADRYDEQATQKATAFCIRYDSQRDWIPLCQIAQITNPTKKHSRKMFNDFCRLTRSVQQRILEINGIKKLELSGDDWWYAYLVMFENDYRKYKLGDERYLYAFTQYFPKLLRYGDVPIRSFTQRILHRKSSLRS